MPLNAPQPRPGEILIVDDEVFIQNAFKLYFETLGYRVRIADGRESAMREFRNPEADIDVIILDLVMPGCSGIELLGVFKEEVPEIEVIIATGCGSISSAIEAMRNGAFDYITKPIVDFDQELLAVVEDALVRRRSHHVHRRRGPGGQHPLATTPQAVEQSLSLLDSLTRFAQTCARPEASAESLLETLEDAFGIRGGLHFDRDPEGRPGAPVAWGPVAPVEFGPGWFSDREAFEAVSQGRFHLLSCEDLELLPLGLQEVQSELHPLACHLPVPRLQTPPDSLFLFFSKDVAAFNAEGPVHNGAPLLLLAPFIADAILPRLSREPVPEA